MSSPIEQPVAICTGADAKYFQLVDGLLASLESALLPNQWQICLFDLGLTLDQRANIEERGVRVVSPSWSLDFPNRDITPTWLKAMVDRPFLPQHFPGFETYVWLDADTWVQQRECLVELVGAVGQHNVALVLEQFGPAQTYSFVGSDGKPYRLDISEKLIRENIERGYRASFGSSKAHYAQGPITNSGVFAIRHDSNVWSVWQRYLSLGLQQAARGEIHFLVEQSALNLAYLEGKIRIEAMPTVFNWTMATLPPVLDVDRQLLVSHSGQGQQSVPLGIVHLADLKPLHQITLQSTDGQSVIVPLRYREFAARHHGV